MISFYLLLYLEPTAMHQITLYQYPPLITGFIRVPHGEQDNGYWRPLHFLSLSILIWCRNTHEDGQLQHWGSKESKYLGGPTLQGTSNTCSPRLHFLRVKHFVLF